MDYVDIIRCVKRNELIECTDHNHLKIRNGVLEANLREKTFALFVHNVNEVTICSGLEFQVYIWGLEKYVLWLLPPGVSHCITLSNAFLDPCSNYVYAVSKTPNACNMIPNSSCKYELLKIADALRVPIFISLNIETPRTLPVNVVLYDSMEDQCFVKIHELRDKLSLATR